ncbi:MAG: DUF3568 family protein [Planctomycetota bacterium]
MRALVVCLALLIVGASSGCLARGGLAGELERNLDASVALVHQAVLAVVRTRGLDLQTESVDHTDSLIKARGADNTPITFHTERFTDKASQLTIQIGTFGDEARSRELFDAIAEHLSQAAAGAASAPTGP